MVDVESLSICLDTPESQWKPYDRFDLSPPPPPRGGNRVAYEITRLVLENLDSLSAPSFESGNSPAFDYNFSSSYNPQTPMFNSALLRMRQGDALQRLRGEREAAFAKELEEKKRTELAAERLRSMSLQDAVKDGPSSPRVTLGRSPPARCSSGMARSA